MRDMTIRLPTGLAESDAADRLARLFESEGMQISRDANTIRSVRIPFPIVSTDPARYSRRNWVGLNPFTSLTVLEAACASDSDGRTLVTVRLDRRRTLLRMGLWAVLTVTLALAAPLWAGVVVTIAVSVANAIGWRLYPSLVRKEMEACLKAPMTRHLACLPLLALLAACFPGTTPVTKKGYKGDPPLGTPIVLAPADELDVDGDGTGDGWWWVPFDGSTAPEERAVCGDGSTTGLAISPGTSGDLVVFLDGGGACWSYETCAAGAAVDRSFDVGKFKVEARDFIPCSLTARAQLPPALAGATVVFVPYCTGDVHGGDNVKTYGNALFSETWHHAGHANLRAYLRRLAATWTAPGKLVVAGSSAGGFGALLNYELFRWYWPAAQGYLLDDSGPALVGGEVPSVFRAAWYDAWRLGIALDPWCLDCRSDLSAAFAELARQHRDDRLALLSHQQDQVMSLFMLQTGAQFAGALSELERSVLSPAGARAFLEAGSDHMLLTPLEACAPGAGLGGQVAAGEGLDAWLQEMLSDDPAWATRTD